MFDCNLLIQKSIYLSSEAEEDRIALNVPVNYSKRMQILERGDRAVRNARHVPLGQPERRGVELVPGNMISHLAGRRQ